MTHDEMIAVIQAHKEGKKLEFCNSNLIWKEVIGDPCFNFFRYSYRIKPELTREEITAKWVKDNDVKVGDKVVRTVGDDNTTRFEIKEIWPKSIYIDMPEHKLNVGHDVEELKKITSKIVKFTFEDREEFRGKWVKGKNGVEYLITLIRPSGIGFIDVDGCVSFVDYEKALERIEFIDGRPFGKEIWE